MTNNYDIANAISRTEERLINDLIKQLKKKSSMEMIKKGDIESWKLDQLKALQEYKKRNEKYFTQDNYDELLKKVETELLKQYKKGGEVTQKQIKEALKNGFNTNKEPSDNFSASFSGVNDRKLQSLINETTSNLFQAEYSALRYADDSYRKIIFDAHTYFQTGSGTLAQAIDMATKDFLSAGINSVEYKDGRRVNIQSYSEMALRTANKRAYMQGEAGMRDEYGLDLVIVTRRGNACPLCMEYVGKVFIDDVYGNGKPDGKHPLLSSAIAGGLYHPNCRDVHTTYFDGITTERPAPTDKEKQEANRVYQLEQHQRYLERNVRKYDRLYKGATDEANQTKYKALRHEWSKRTKEFVDAHDELKRKYYRERAVTLPKDTTNKTVPTPTPTPTPAKPEFKPARNRQEAYQMLTNNNIKFNIKKLDKMEDNYLLKSTNQLTKLKQQFTKHNTYEMTTMNRQSGGIANCKVGVIDEGHNPITFNLKYNGDEYVGYTVERNSDTGHFMPVAKGNETEYIVTHEFGHSLEDEIALGMLSEPKYQKLVDDEFKILRSTYKSPTDDSLILHARNTTYGKVIKDIRYEITNIFNELHPNDKIRDYVSGYGKTNEYEFFAELFANATLGEPNKAGEAMIKFLKKKGYDV